MAKLSIFSTSLSDINMQRDVWLVSGQTQMSDVWSDMNICYEVQDNPGNCILAPVKLLPSVIFPLNRALIYGQTAPAGLWPNRMFQKVQEVILRAAAGAHKFLELSLGQVGVGDVHFS